MKRARDEATRGLRSVRPFTIDIIRHGGDQWIEGKEGLTYQGNSQGELFAVRVCNREPCLWCVWIVE